MLENEPNLMAATVQEPRSEQPRCEIVVKINRHTTDTQTQTNKQTNTKQRQNRIVILEEEVNGGVNQNASCERVAWSAS